MYQLTSIIELSCILCFVSMAAILTFRFAGFPDLSVDGVFSLGAVVAARLLLAGCNIPTAIIGSIIAGALIGSVTATVAGRLKINPLLASVLILTILYTVNIRILGKANQPLYGVIGNIFKITTVRLIILISLSVVLSILTFLFFRTQIGSALRCTGSSPSFLISVARNVDLYQVILVAMAGSMVATSGALLALKYGFADVSFGTGTIIIGIASLIIGEKICGRESLSSQIIAAPCGILIYELIVGIALSAGISPTDVKLGTGVLTIILLALSKNERNKLFT